MDDTMFDKWLSDRFRELNTDEAVFVPYIKSILEGDETAEEKIDALDGILGELAEADGNSDVGAFRKEIILRWEERQKKNEGASSGGGDPNVELDSKMERLLKLNDDLTGASSNQDEKDHKHLVTQIPDSTLRAAILNQCQDSGSGNESDGEGPSASAGHHSSGGGGFGGSGLERNTNAERVQNELKDKREREKVDAARKREKDKEDRAKQKQQAQERKDKAKKKAAKVERKR